KRSKPMFRHWFPQLTRRKSRRNRRPTARRPHTARPQVELLEGREAPAVFQWGGGVSAVWNTSGNWSIESIIGGRSVFVTTNQVPGTGDEIRFPANAQRQTGQTTGYATTPTFDKIIYQAGGYMVSSGSIGVGVGGIEMTAGSGAASIGAAL